MEKKCYLADFAVPIDYRVEIKENEKIEKYQDLARELKNMCYMNVAVIQIVGGAIGMVSKGQGKRLGESLVSPQPW